MSHPVTNQRTLPYAPSLDGLRALCVLGVIASHIAVSHSAGFGIGVHVFFVLSGFLISRILIRERRRYGEFRLRLFYVKRVLRLFPALVCVVLATDIYMLLFSRAAPTTATVGSTLPTLFYYANWEWFAHGPQSLGWFGHCWSLSVEEQFYIAWPPLLTLAWPANKQFAHQRTVKVLGLACVVVLLFRTLNVLRTPQLGFQVFGTHEIADQLLFGCILAILIECGDTERIGRVSQLAGPAGGAFLFFYALFLTSVPFKISQTVGLTVVGLSAASLVAHLITHPESRIASTLSLRPLVYLGKISYGLYLWHILVSFGLGDQINFGAGEHRYYWVLCYALTIAVAALSYRFIETPFLGLKSRLGPSPTSVRHGSFQPQG